MAPVGLDVLFMISHRITQLHNPNDSSPAREPLPDVVPLPGLKLPPFPSRGRPLGVTAVAAASRTNLDNVKRCGETQLFH